MAPYMVTINVILLILVSFVIFNHNTQQFAVINSAIIFSVALWLSIRHFLFTTSTIYKRDIISDKNAPRLIEVEHTSHMLLPAGLAAFGAISFDGAVRWIALGICTIAIGYSIIPLVCKSTRS